MSTRASKPRRMICQINPKIKCSRPSARSELPILTTEQPIALAELMTILLFSVIWKALRGLRGVGLLRTRESIVSGTESLISLQRIRPSRHSSKSCIVEVGIGSRLPISGSPSRTWHKMSIYLCLSVTRNNTNSIDMTRELCPLVFVDGVAHVRIRSLNSHLALSCG